MVSSTRKRIGFGDIRPRCLGITYFGIVLSQVLLLAGEDFSFGHRFTRLLSSDLREAERELGALRHQLTQFPPISPGHSGINKGLHSRFQPEKDTPLEITIDLGQSYLLDRIAVFPVQGMFRGAMVDGYGFPEHFVIELSEEADFNNVALTLDSQSSLVITRPNYPRQFVMDRAVKARHVRLRVLRHWTRGDGKFLSAFGELMVLSGGRNVALYSSVKGTSFTNLPDWFRHHLVDGQTDLGLNVGPEPSPTNGFLSRTEDNRFSEKWIQLELPRTVQVDEVAIIPAQPIDAPDQFGHGFPRRFRLLISEDEHFADSEIIADFSSERHFPNPGDTPVVFPVEGRTARFVRLEVTELWHTAGGRFSVSLAEILVMQNGENLALGAKVTASDVFDVERFLDVWRLEFLVDGHSSQNRLIKLEDWLTGLDERSQVEVRIHELTNGIEQRIEDTLGWVLGGTVLIAGCSLGMIGMMIVRRKRALSEQQEALRARIARDLHDDLGSRLGGMRLLSESLLKADELPESLRQDIDLLNRSSGEATDAMRDIVWLLDTRERSLEKLRQQLKLLVPSIIGSMPWEFHVDQAPDAEVDFEFRRQIVLAFRESLNNAARHSNSPQVECRVGGDGGEFWFEVRDHGRGFEEDSTKKGLGLKNLRRRAEVIGGAVTIDSRPDSGAMIRFVAPYRRTKRHRLP